MVNTKIFLIIFFFLNFLIGQEISVETSVVVSDSANSKKKIFSDYTIDSSSVNNDDIIIIGGNLIVEGKVNGKITVIGGDISFGPFSEINGTIISIGGNIHKHKNAIINGKLIESHLKEGLVYREMDPADSVEGDSELTITEPSIHSTESWIHAEKDVFVYNRNEGLVFNLNKTWDGAKKSSFRISTSLGYRFGSNDGVGRLSLEKGFGSNNNVILFASTFKESRTDDYFRLPEGENSWASILARQDFYDRWDEEGWSAGIGFDLYHIKLKLMTASVKQDSIPIQTDLWSMFEKERILRNNPSFYPQTQMDYVQATAAFQTSHFSPLSTGIAIFLQGEVYQNADDGEKIYTFKSSELRQRIFGFMKLNWEMPYGIVLRTQFMVGKSKGMLHDFRKFGIGGLGSVSAFPYKYQIGDQMLQMNGELVFTEEFTDSWYFFKLFIDSGYAWEASSFKFKQQDFIHVGISSAGIGIGSSDHDGLNWSVNVAKPLDGRELYETTIRLNYNY
ncbi:MAG TPA: hypothetical protein QGF08_02980 [Candidatus Marinimicrobia bacterium]|jgi:hypothetical protein|nr:hypothetical protein [Candidatus Neomarinimicrobiota bacterium]MDP7329671.1 hypothetical protein [Candidatus Neomarinimicrobiota bacterium]MDP7436287.1 hypothetical protein [Candidatus Neomarinimicrobiota bacterium]HJL75428.1 hypothetical protein [Candidatus Neomarinimicrobiota bacterium]HJM69828.1 hypothetical protein [Candidatus Neomarinimicrobiota bacterium]|tara:strand:+ start:2925 stop:4439 length:1515 start_codon:yes stop_codon:yes gene_type:complete